MARNMYTIHSVTIRIYYFFIFLFIIIISSMSKLATVIHIVVSKLAIFVATTVDGRDLISTCRGRGDLGGGGGGTAEGNDTRGSRGYPQRTKPPCIQYSTGKVQNRCAFSIRPAKYKTAVRSVFDRQHTKPLCIQYSTGKVQNRSAFSI